jgi:hypothetical protein
MIPQEQRQGNELLARHVVELEHNEFEEAKEFFLCCRCLQVNPFSKLRQGVVRLEEEVIGRARVKYVGHGV